MEALYEVLAFAEEVEARLADARHYVHVEYDVNRVGYFDTDFSEVASDDAHRIGNDVHRSALHGTAGNFVRKLVSLFRVHPVVDGAGVLSVFGADKCSVLDARNVVYFRAVKVAVGQKILVELDKLAAFYRLFLQRFNLCRAAVNPYDFVGLTDFGAFRNKVKNVFVFCQCHFLSP